MWSSNKKLFSDQFQKVFFWQKTNTSMLCHLSLSTTKMCAGQIFGLKAEKKKTNWNIKIEHLLEQKEKVAM